MIEEAILTVTKGDAAVSALVGTRVYSPVLPVETSLPAIRFWRVSSEPRELFQSGPTNVANSRFQFDCVARDPKTAKQVAAAIISLWHGYKGSVGGETIMLSRVLNELEAFDWEAGTFQVPVDVTIQYRE